MFSRAYTDEPRLADAAVNLYASWHEQVDNLGVGDQMLRYLRCP